LNRQCRDRKGMEEGGGQRGKENLETRSKMKGTRERE
jgi:hypothetical protein